MMMQYRVVKDFVDLKDGNHFYHTGDKFPRDGYEVTAERLMELSTCANRRRTVLVAMADEKPVEKPVEPEIKEKKRGKKDGNRSESEPPAGDVPVPEELVLP